MGTTMEEVLLAPTALSKQAFKLRGKGGAMHLECDAGMSAGADVSGCADPLLVVGNDESRPDTCPDHMRQGKAQAEATK